jgi:hypothetical protein
MFPKPQTSTEMDRVSVQRTRTVSRNAVETPPAHTDANLNEAERDHHRVKVV